ncbi:nucleoside triphosphate pyrophosphohydrolase [Patescibacteria group bacterium]|nr:nucleoside triphosphate pyrophosphohydrolase [Patescibacteria group bacterium]
MNNSVFEEPKSPEKKKDEYPKLIRDGIPEIIEKEKGRKPETRTLDEGEFKMYLLKKMAEEAAELQEAEDKEHLEEELADVLELLGEILEVNGLNLGEIQKIQKEKAEKRGGFKKRILMLNNVD